MSTKHFFQQGLSIIEIIIALALFVVIASSSVVAIAGSLSISRLAEEETLATQFATQGIEATQSIRNQNWDNITNGAHGATQSGSTWVFSGTSDDPNGGGKFTRVISIGDVQRNSSGVIVSSGGTVDTETKIATSSVTWNFSPTRSNSVSLTTYLTNWQLSKNKPGSGAPSITTCGDYCINQAYSAGTCRANTNQCDNNSEIYNPAGDSYCTGGANADKCCCAP
ncbi:hypothetical protein KA017_01565 [Candidatus Woesebacteria bacterium]|nr:hypothetical protein [Candidatus Woesebacteria bacterium]